MRDFDTKTFFIVLTMFGLVMTSGCGRRTKVREPIVPPERDLFSGTMNLNASPLTAPVGQTISIEASFGEITAFDFEFVGALPAGVTFLDNQRGFKIVRVTSTVVAQNITIRARPSGQTEPTQEVVISFFEEVDETPPPLPPLRCEATSLTGDRSRVGASGIFKISETSQNTPLIITRIWTNDIYEQGNFWGGSASHAILRFRTPGYKTIFIEATEANWYATYSASNTHSSRSCTAQTNVFVEVPTVQMVWWLPPRATPTTTPTPKRLEYRWISTQGGSCSSVCQQAGMLSTPYTDGNYCASGEVRPAGVNSISYAYDTWGSGTEFTSGQSIGRYCYGSKPGKTQKQDNDSTDITVACYCRTDLN